jgi:hypothetical protein
MPRQVACGRFNLNNVSAEVGEQFRSEGGRHSRATFNDPNRAEGISCLIFHSHMGLLHPMGTQRQTSS